MVKFKPINVQVKHLLIVLGSFFFVVTNSLWAQQLRVSPESVEVGVGEIFEINYILEDASMSDFQAPSFNDFSILGGPIKSTSIQIINGTMSKMASISYSLQPKRTGTFTIPAATVTTDKKQVLRSGKATVNVVKGGSSQSPVPPTGGRNLPAPFGGQGFPFPGMPQSTSPTMPSGAADVSVRIVTDTAQVYQGEQVTATIRIYSTANVADVNLLTPPTFTGFWVEDITENSSTKSHQEKINGKIYTAFDVKRYALFPQQAGRFTIEPIDVEVSVQMPDPTWGSFFYRTQTLRLRSDSAIVRANELPEEGKPADFSGAVGTFSISANANVNQLKTGDPFSLHVIISGEGNIKLLQKPDFTFPNIVEAYDPQVTEDIFTKMDKINGRRSFEYSVMPLKTGMAMIPPISFSYYDTRLRQYQTLRTNAIPLRIAQGSNPAPSSGNNDDTATDSTSSLAIWQYLLPILLIMGIGGGLLYRNINHKTAKIPTDVYTVGMNNYLRTKKTADHPVMVALAKAKMHLSKGKTRLFYDETHQVLTDYLTRQFDIKPADLSTDHIRQTLSEHLPEPDAQLMATLVQQCEIALFAPIETQPDEAQWLYEQATSLIERIENSHNV